jgi:hypothetical protein
MSITLFFALLLYYLYLNRGSKSQSLSLAAHDMFVTYGINLRLFAIAITYRVLISAGYIDHDSICV